MSPTVILDCDGILADFTAAALGHLFDITGERVDPGKITTWEWVESLPHLRADTVREVRRRLKADGGCPRRPGDR